MKINRLFIFALTAMSLAACSKDDNPSDGDGNGQGNGKLIDAISVSFVNSGKGTTTRGLYDNDADGVGTENSVFDAYVFAREANPQHPGALQGDWTVKRVHNADGSAILAGNSGTVGTLSNTCSFSNVRQGENVYVIANDPNMNLDLAEQISRKGVDSEASIKAYVSSLTKEYINGLTTKVPNGSVSTALPNPPADSKFIMAGMATIPTNPNVANGDNVTVAVGLDRELAKVAFSATVTATPTDEAYGKVEFNYGTTGNDATQQAQTDGIVIVRIPRQVSFFTTWDRDWYFPAVATQYNKDWKMKSDTESDDAWVNVFPGDKNKNDDPAAAGTPTFNTIAYNSSAKEYRLAWMLNSAKLENSGADATQYEYVTYKDKDNNKTLESPIFYVTPNYADNAGCATVICTQATYVGPNLLVNDLTGSKPFQALAEKLFDKLGMAGGTTLETVTWDATNIGKLTTYVTTAGNADAVKAALKDIYKSDEKIDETYNAVKSNATAANVTVAYKKYDKVYYRADVAGYNPNGISDKITKRNYFYQIQGTITSLGAKSIEEAITSTEIGMVVQVVVRPWTVVVNKVNM